MEHFGLKVLTEIWPGMEESNWDRRHWEKCEPGRAAVGRMGITKNFGGAEKLSSWEWENYWPI